MTKKINKTRKEINKNKGTFEVIIRFQNQKWELDPDHYPLKEGEKQRKRIAIGWGEPMLFYASPDSFWYDPKYGECTTVFTEVEGHCNASWEYFIKDTHTPKTKEEIKAANALFKWYLRFCKEKWFDGEPLPVRKLRRSYTKTKH